MKYLLIVFCLIFSGLSWASSSKSTQADGTTQASLKDLSDGFDDRQPSDIILEGGKDNQQNTFGNLSVDLGLSNGDLLFVNGQSSKYKDQTTGEISTTRGFGLGYTFNPDDPLSITPSYQNWGARSDLATNSLLLDFTWNLADWTLGIQPELKTITWETTANSKVRTTLGGLNAHIDYLGVKNFDFQIFAGGMNDGNQKFQNFLYSGYITDSAMALESGLVKNYAGIGLIYHLLKWTLGANAQNTTYIVDTIKSKSWSGFVKYQITKAWSLGYTYTHIDTQDNPSTYSNALRVGYTW